MVSGCRRGSTFLSHFRDQHSDIVTERHWVAVANTAVKPAQQSFATLELYSLAVFADLSVVKVGNVRSTPARIADTEVSTESDTAIAFGLVDPTQGFWRLLNEDESVTGFFFGNPEDHPIMGDWNCDGVDTPGMYRRADGYVYLRNANLDTLSWLRK